MNWFQRTFFLPMDRREEVLDQLYQASSPGFDYFLLVVCRVQSQPLGWRLILQRSLLARCWLRP
jgi:hypothetical protein